MVHTEHEQQLRAFANQQEWYEREAAHHEDWLEAPYQVTYQRLGKIGIPIAFYDLVWYHKQNSYIMIIRKQELTTNLFRIISQVQRKVFLEAFISRLIFHRTSLCV